MTNQTVEMVKETAQSRLAQLGMDEQPVAVLNVQQKSLRDNGFLVDIDVTGVSQFFASVDWHLDLGIPQTDERRKSGRLTPGRKCLINKAGKFRSLETRVRYNLEKYSFKVALFGDYRYVPDTAFMAWHEAHEAICAEWDEEKESLLDRYDQLVYEAEVEFSGMARETWLTLMARNDPESRKWIEENDLQSFTESVVSAARKSMPTRNDIQTKLAIKLQPMATFLLGDEQAQLELEREQALAEADKIRQERDHWARQEAAFTRQQEAKAQAAEAEAYEKELAAKAERQERERVAQAEAQEKIERAKAETAAIKAAQLEIARKAVLDMANPYAEVMQDLRSNVYDTVTEVLDNIRKHGRVLGKTKEKIDNLVSLFSLLHNPAVTPDPELEAAFNTLKSAMGQQGSDTKRDTDAIKDALTDVKLVAGNLVGELAQETRLSTGGWEQLDL